MKFSYLLTMSILLFSIPVLAQKGRVINGRITGQGTENLAGVTVTEANTSNSVTSDASGNYSIRLTRDKSAILFSYVGFANKEVAVGQGASIDVQLSPGGSALAEVVVTAFGIKREKKALGYSVQTVNSSDLNVNRQPNVVNALQGKMAGVTITSGGGAPGQGKHLFYFGCPQVQVRARDSIVPMQRNR